MHHSHRFSSVIFFIISLFFIHITCSLDPVVHQQEQIGQYYAFCTLSPSIEKQEVIVGRAIPESMPEDISDADVMIASTDQIVRFVYIGNGIYQDRNKELSVLPGETYQLHVKFSDGEIITGNTT
ncbi:hypothetical protein JW960_19860 [candidate division KSB1 bacterium]|nr:hypothetical protein [candidate division KSB1 bacterium]